ncbi:uncharacterized protein LOC120632144 [Pararge aegeria]|uniref:uncharacterized protein LOC120632144 n=1 Tax=Pararge aegeria TaxID=116150 RepID=UPI0019D02C54|nr:uncharacterized protein LOC120632144 [Pararge aegeria]
MESLKNNLMAFSGVMTSAGQMAFDANFTKYLAAVARETNITNIIYKLSPKCESMLVRCSWGMHRTACRHLFAKRVTDLGYCCVFNARYSLEDRNNTPFRATMVGQDSGLSVVIQENTDDFTAVRRTGEELQLLLFDGSQYPLTRAGVIRSYPVRRSASVFVTLRATVQRASDSLRHYSEAWFI